MTYCCQDLFGTMGTKKGSAKMKQISYCQSCGMPMKESKDFGTDLDGRKNHQYCNYCYQNGTFLQNFTMEEMIEFCLDFEADSGRYQNREEAKKAMLEWFSTLDRWAGSPVLLDIPSKQYIMVEGSGSPQNEEYRRAIEMLYLLSAMIAKQRNEKTFGQFFDLMPPEGLWDCGSSGFDPDPNHWSWIMMLEQPNEITPEVFRRAQVEAQNQYPEFPFHLVRLEKYTEGLCVQITHVGSYQTEQTSIDRLSQFIQSQDLVDQCGARGKHHEIYLSDPQTTPPDQLKTVLRHPVARR